MYVSQLKLYDSLFGNPKNIFQKGIQSIVFISKNYKKLEILGILK
jgi:hypothetical protein